MSAPIDTKKIAERVKHLRGLAFEPPVYELCGYIEHFLSERKEMLRSIAVSHEDFPACGCQLCTQYRELTTVGDTPL